ncbi:MAG: hypothetical protein HOP10_01545 [Chitinophagaceae bacterium]|nr:hypothetical protein [Chitinophagaceae bacterium]
MMVTSIRRLFAAAALSASLIASNAQSSGDLPAKKEAPPYKVITSGKQITIKSSKTIQHVMLWTTDGNRVAEHKQINANSFTLNPGVSQKTFFLMVGLNNGNIYTEKLVIP